MVAILGRPDKFSENSIAHMNVMLFIAMTLSITFHPGGRRGQCPGQQQGCGEGMEEIDIMQRVLEKKCTWPRSLTGLLGIERQENGMYL